MTKEAMTLEKSARTVKLLFLFVNAVLFVRFPLISVTQLPASKLSWGWGWGPPEPPTGLWQSLLAG